jgi:hypothetical protein
VDHVAVNQIPLRLESMLWAHRRRTIVASALLCQPVRNSGCDWGCCMQGNCAGAPPSAASMGLSGAPLLPLLPLQCFLIADTNLWRSGSQLWLDGLYVRYRRTGRYDRYKLINPFIFYFGSLWMTAVTLQGDGDGILDCQEDCGVYLQYGKMYAEGELLVCHTEWCSSLTPIAAPQRLLPPRHTCAPPCEGVALPRTACTNLLRTPLTPLQRLTCRLHIRGL